MSKVFEQAIDLLADPGRALLIDTLTEISNQFLSKNQRIDELEELVKHLNTVKAERAERIAELKQRAEKAEAACAEMREHVSKLLGVIDRANEQAGDRQYPDKADLLQFVRLALSDTVIEDARQAIAACAEQEQPCDD